MKSKIGQIILCVCLAALAGGCSGNKQAASSGSQLVPRYQPGPLEISAEQRATIQAGIAKVQNNPNMPAGQKQEEIAQMQMALNSSTPSAPQGGAGAMSLQHP